MTMSVPDPSMPIGELGLPVRTANALARAGLTTLGALRDRWTADVITPEGWQTWRFYVRGVGPMGDGAIYDLMCELQRAEPE